MPACKSCEKPTMIRVRATSDDGTRCYADAYLCEGCIGELVSEGWLEDPNQLTEVEKAALKKATAGTKGKGKK